MRRPIEQWEAWIASPLTQPEELATFILDEENDSLEFQAAREQIYLGVVRQPRVGSKAHLKALLMVPEVNFVAVNHFGWVGAKLLFATQIYNHAVRLASGGQSDPDDHAAAAV